MSRKSCLDRRDFLRTNAAIAAAMTVAPGRMLPAQQAEVSPHNRGDRPRVACIGVGGRGMAIAKQAAQYGEIVAVCDADLSHAQRAAAAFDDKPDVYQDYRRVLDRDDVDVVTNGTPDHWHTLINVAACRAGKDVYTEKPLTLTIDEGKILRQVVEDTQRVVQVGTQQRSTRAMQTAVELVRNGRLGRLQQVWVALPYFSTKGGPFRSQPVPASLDWDLYQGQAPVHPYCQPRTHSNFRWWYEYAGGITTDWGNHHVDIAHWGMDCETTGPVSVNARGLFPNAGKADCYNTADRFVSRMIYPNDIELIYFVALGEQLKYGRVEDHAVTTDQQINGMFGDLPDEMKTFERNGIMFVGDRGRLFVNRGGLYGRAAEQLAENPLPADAWRVRPSDNHMGNFFACVASREEPVSPVRIQHRTITACHLTNISLRLDRPLAWDPLAECIIADEEAQSWLKREQRVPYQIET